MSYELRKLKAKDIFPMCSIIKKIGIDEFKNCFNNPEITKLVQSSDEKGDTLNASVGFAVVMDIVSIIVGNLPKAEKEIYSFLASISNQTVQQIQDMEMVEFIGMIKDVVTKEEFKDFFNQASEFLK